MILTFNFVPSWLKQWGKDFSKDWNEKTNLENVQTIVTIFVSLIAVISGAGAAFTYIYTKIKQNEIAQQRDLSTYKDYGKYLTTYHDEIQPSIAEFIGGFKIQYTKNNDIIKIIKNTETTTDQNLVTILFKKECPLITSKKYCFRIKKDPKLINQQDLNKFIYTEPKEQKRYTDACKALLESTKSLTGHEFFYSEQWSKFRKIHLFYEALGLGIENGSIQFKTVFNSIIYPAFWNDEEVTNWAYFDPLFEIENCLRDYWFGIENENNLEGNQLVDFSNNFIRLGTNYHYARVYNKYKQENCRRWWQFWRIWIFVEEEQCKNLRSNIKEVEKLALMLNSPSKFQLYDDPSIEFKIQKLILFARRNLIEIILIILAFFILRFLWILYINKNNDSS